MVAAEESDTVKLNCTLAPAARVETGMVSFGVVPEDAPANWASVPLNTAVGVAPVPDVTTIVSWLQMSVALPLGVATAA